ncbi:MAG: hypothetical protein IKN57_00850 [Parasporobacterium sp.]|nr:hypothetical protein [Parasporobacterium sp.]
MKMQPFTRWNGTMTPKERFRAQMHYRPFDRTVNMEFGYWKENYEQWDLFLDNNIKTEKDANRFFGFEIPAALSGNIWIAPPFEETILEEKAGSIVKIDGNGLKVEVPKDGHSTIPRCIGSSVETPEDWKRVKEEHFVRYVEERKVDRAALDRFFAEHKDEPVGVDCGSMIGKIRDMLTLEGLAYAVCDYPEMVEDMVETCCCLVDDFLDQVLPGHSFDFASGWEDICCKNGPLIQMDFFKSAVVPRYKRIGDKLHRHGIDLWYTDCDGDVRPLVPYFLEAGINCLFPYEVNSCVHPADLLKEYQGTLRIMGGFDKMQMIRGKESIKAYMESLEPLVAAGGYIPFCDHRCPPDVTPENYLYYLDLKRRMFGLNET